MLWINFKTYSLSSGPASVRLAQTCLRVAQKTGVPIIPVVQAIDLFRVTSRVEGEVWAQHLDQIEPGQNTGWLGPETALASGAKGTLLNHSEHKLEPSRVMETTAFLKKKKIKVAICCSSLAEGEVFSSSQPDFLVFEPPELIASTETSVSRAKPETVARFVERFGKLPVLIGAGIKDAQDIKAGLKLGARGFLIASAVVKATDPEAVLTELAQAAKD